MNNNNNQNENREKQPQDNPDNDEYVDESSESLAEFDIASYTNGNMAELIEEEKAALQKDKEEFMYAFEGCMSVIRETEEPEEDMTMKNSCKSSSLQIARPESMQRSSKEPVP